MVNKGGVGQICKWIAIVVVKEIWDAVKQEYVYKPVKEWIEECSETYPDNPGYGGNPIQTEQQRLNI